MKFQDADFQKHLMYFPAIMQNMHELISVTDDSFEISYLCDFMFYGGYQLIKRWVNEGCRIPAEKWYRS